MISIKINNALNFSALSFSLLRGQDSNVRPPGYEPGELPTAPPRDVNRLFLKSGAKVALFFELAKC